MYPLAPRKSTRPGNAARTGSRSQARPPCNESTKSSRENTTTDTTSRARARCQADLGVEIGELSNWLTCAPTSRRDGEEKRQRLRICSHQQRNLCERAGPMRSRAARSRAASSADAQVRPARRCGTNCRRSTQSNGMGIVRRQPCEPADHAREIQLADDKRSGEFWFWIDAVGAPTDQTSHSVRGG